MRKKKSTFSIAMLNNTLIKKKKGQNEAFYHMQIFMHMNAASPTFLLCYITITKVKGKKSLSETVTFTISRGEEKKIKYDIADVFSLCLPLQDYGIFYNWYTKRKKSHLNYWKKKHFTQLTNIISITGFENNILNYKNRILHLFSQTGVQLFLFTKSVKELQSTAINACNISSFQHFFFKISTN